MFSYAPFLDERFENVLLRWSKNLYGITVLPPRQVCGCVGVWVWVWVWVRV